MAASTKGDNDMWQLIDKPKTVLVTKRLATEFAEMDAAPHDRKLSERRLMVYSRMLSTGAFRPVTWAKAFCQETDGTYRVNGKHTSVMLSGLPEPLPEFYAVIESYHCETLEDVAKLYATFDSTTQTRTAADIYGSFAATVPELRGMSCRILSSAIGALSYQEWGEGYSSKATAAERAELILDNADFALWLQMLITEDVGSEERRTARFINRVPVAAAMLQTWKKAKGDSSEFWRSVRDETGGSPGTPDRKLARYLALVGVGSGGRGSQKAKVASPREIYVKCLHAWNAWRRNESTDLNYYPDAPVPAVR